MAGRRHRRGGRRGAGAARGRRAGPRPPRPRDPARDLRASSTAGRSGCRRSRWPSARSRTRSRTSTSPTCCRQGLIKRTPRGRAATTAAFAHLGPAGARAGVAASAGESRRCSGDRGGLDARLPYSVGSWPIRSSAPTAAIARASSTAHRLHAPAQGLREVRLRVPVRAARRLLPGPRRGVLRVRQGGPRDRLRARTRSRSPASRRRR